MKQSITIQQAARAAKCAKSTVVRLIKKGVLKGEIQVPENGGRKTWVVFATREQVAETVTANVKKHGYKWASTKAKAKAAKANGVINAGLAEVVKWAALTESKRALLTQLAERTDDELALLLSLVK